MWRRISLGLLVLFQWRSCLAIDDSFNEYLGHVYGTAEDYWGFSQVYNRLLESAPEIAEHLLTKYIRDDKLKTKVIENKVPSYQKDGILSLLPGGKSEWPQPGSKLANYCSMGRIFLETKNWSALEELILEDILTDSAYKSAQLPRRIVVAGGLALMDFKNKYPNCIAPWKVDEDGNTKLTVGKKAKIIALILKLRAKKIELSEVQTACGELGIINDRALCVRILVAGGYSRAEEIFDEIKDYDERTKIAGCFYLEHYGPKAALKYYNTRNVPVSEHDRDFVEDLSETLSPLQEWHAAAKQLTTICPCRHTELPIYAKTRQLHIVDQKTLISIKNTETMFWVLVAAQYKEIAKDMLNRLTKALDPVLGKIHKKKADKITNNLDEMEEAWLETNTVALYHVAEFRKEMDEVINSLLQGDITAAMKIQKEVIGATIKSGKCENATDNPSNKFISLLINAFRNPQLLNPTSIRIFRHDDWEYNWYVAEVVQKLVSGEKYIELVNDTVPQDLFNLQQSLIYFFAGRFETVLEISKANEVPDIVLRHSKLCSMRREDVCDMQPIAGDDELTTLSQTLPPKLCKTIVNAKSMRVVHDSVFKLSPEGLKTLESLGGETYLQPPLPGELPIVPLETMFPVRILTPPLALDIERRKELAQQKQHAFNILAIPTDPDQSQITIVEKGDKFAKRELKNAFNSVLKFLNSVKNAGSFSVSPAYRTNISLITNLLKEQFDDFKESASKNLDDDDFENFQEFMGVVDELDDKRRKIEVDPDTLKSLLRVLYNYRRYLKLHQNIDR